MSDQDVIQALDLDDRKKAADVKKYWQPTTNRYVAYLEICGFKEMVAQNKHSFIEKKMLQLSEQIKNIEIDALNKIKKYIIIHEQQNRKSGLEYEIEAYDRIVRPIMHSDSILLVSNTDHPYAAFNMFRICQQMLMHCIAVDLPVKGAISLGNFTCDFETSLFLGKPLLDSYLLQQELSYFGIVLHHSAEKNMSVGPFIQIKNIHLPFNPYEILIHYKTPFKSGRVFHLNIAPHSGSYAKMSKALTHYYQNVSGESRLYVDNTLEFLNLSKEIKENSERISKPRKDIPL